MDNDITLCAIKKLTMGELGRRLSAGSFQLDERRDTPDEINERRVDFSLKERAARREKGSCIAASGHRASSPLAASARFPKTRQVPSIIRRPAPKRSPSRRAVDR